MMNDEREIGYSCADGLLKEADELIAILVTNVKTIKKRKTGNDEKERTC